MSFSKNLKLLLLASTLTLTSMTTIYGKTVPNSKQATVETKKDKQLEIINKILGETEEATEKASNNNAKSDKSTPTATTSQPGTAQYCFDNKLPLDQISPENCTKRLTAEQWEELLPHWKGKDLSYVVEHKSVAIIHIPNIDTTATTMNGVKLMAKRKDVKNNRLAYLDLTNVRDQVIYYKDGTFKENTNVPKDKDLDDIKFLTFQVIAKESNTPVQILVFPDHFEKDIVPGVDGVPR